MAIRAKNILHKQGDPDARVAEAYALEGQVGHLLRRANQRHTAIFFDALNEQNLTPTQFAALVKIGDETDVSQNRLGRLTAMDPATILGVVKRLQERDLVSARPDPDDGRRSLWSLSKTGKTLLAEVLPIAAQISQTTLAPLNAGEQRKFLELLRKLS